MEAFYSDDFFDLTNNIFFNSLGVFFLNFLIPFIAISVVHIDGIAMGILFSLPTLGYLLSSLFIGYISDHYSKKNLMIVGSFGRGIIYLFLYVSLVSLNLSLLFTSNFFLGLTSGAFLIPFNSLVADKSLEDHRSQAYGIRKVSQGKGIFIGAFIGFTMLLLFKPNLYLMFCPILIFGLANIYASIIYFVHVSDTKIPSSNSIQLENHQKGPLVGFDAKFVIGLLMLFLVTLFFAMEESIMQSYTIPYFLVNLSSNETLATYVYIPVGLVSIIFGSKIGKSLDSINFLIALTTCSILNAFITYLLVLTNNVLVYSLLLTCNEFLSITIALLLVNIISSFSSEHRGKFLGFNSFFTNFGEMIGSFLGGFLWQVYSTKAPFIGSIVLDILLVPVFVISIIFVKHSLYNR